MSFNAMNLAAKALGHPKAMPSWGDHIVKLAYRLCEEGVGLHNARFADVEGCSLYAHKDGEDARFCPGRLFSNSVAKDVLDGRRPRVTQRHKFVGGGEAWTRVNYFSRQLFNRREDCSLRVLAAMAARPQEASLLSMIEMQTDSRDNRLLRASFPVLTVPTASASNLRSWEGTHAMYQRLGRLLPFWGAFSEMEYDRARPAPASSPAHS